MSIAEIIPAVRALSRDEKFRLARLLLDDLAGEELLAGIKRTKRERRFRKGDLVSFQIGLRTVQGKVKEDRGPIGIKGRHLYLVEFPGGIHAESPSLVELPAVEMQAVQGTASRD
jgi:hypothetical protein